MRIRRYSSADAASVASLFRESVWQLCRDSYTPLQLSAWAPDDIDPEVWAERFSDQYSIVAEEGEKLIGFASADLREGYVDMLYVSPSAAGHGVGKQLLLALEAMMETENVSVHASDTAKGFFLHMGYRAVRENTVARRGIELRNWLMEKGK